MEQRGAGSAARTLHNFCAPESFETDRLLAVEVITPGGNWSSWPPHKHDEDVEGARAASAPRRRSTTTRAGRATSASTPRRPARSTYCARSRRGRGADPVRLPRAVDGHARLRPVLPERAGRAGPRGAAVDGVQRRPASTRGCVGPGAPEGTARPGPTLLSDFASSDDADLVVRVVVSAVVALRSGSRAGPAAPRGTTCAPPRFCRCRTPLAPAATTARTAASTVTPMTAKPPVTCPNTIMNSATRIEIGTATSSSTAIVVSRINGLADGARSPSWRIVVLMAMAHPSRLRPQRRVVSRLKCINEEGASAVPSPRANASRPTVRRHRPLRGCFVPLTNW